MPAPPSRGVVTFVIVFAVSDHCQSEVQSRNFSCPGCQFIYKMPTLSGPTSTRTTQVTEMPRDDQHVSWRMAVLLPPCTLVGLVAFRYKYGLRSNLRAPNLKLFLGEHPPSLCMLTYAPSSVPPQFSTTFHCLC